MSYKGQDTPVTKLRDILTKIAIWTAVPADLLAIVPMVFRLFDKSFSWSENVQVENIQFPSLNISIGRDAFIVLVTYAFIAFIYWLVTNIKTTSGKKKHSFIKVLSISVPLIFFMPFLLILISFGSIQTATGFALLFVCIFVTIVTYSRWNRDNTNSYKDMGLLYLLMVPVIWLILQSSNSEPWLNHLGLAWMYAAFGYLFSVVMVGIAILLFILPISHLGFSQIAMQIRKSFATGSWDVQNDKFRQRMLKLFKSFYMFNFDNGWVVIGTLAILILIGLVAFLIVLIKILFIIVFVVLVFVGLGIAAYTESRSRS